MAFCNRFTVVILPSLILLLSTTSWSQTVDCSSFPAWNSTTAYSTAGTKVIYQGILYHNNWYVDPGVNPSSNNGASGSGQPWTSEGTCGTSGSTGTSDNWILEGNTVSASQFIGTLNNQALILKANNLTGLYVNPQKGSVSIGQAYDPNYYKFEVNGGLTAFTGLNQANQNNLLVLYSGSQSTAKYSQGYKHYLGFSHGLFPTGDEYGIMNAYEYNVTSSAGAGKHMLIQNTNEGNLGIGILTTAPAQKLVVAGNTQIGLPISGYNVEGNRLYIGDYFENSDAIFLARVNTADDHSTLRLGIGDNGDNNDVLEIGWHVPSTNVWTPGVRIGANGTIVAKEVCVNLNLAWCDYVFEKDYKLTPLKELKSFISQHKHLPEIPSAREMEKDGLNLNTMVTLQMKKIEELTLYTISQDEKIEALEERLNKLESLIQQTK